jgi:hypothetical protein
MEGYGALFCAERRQVQAIVIRGISDNVVDKEDCDGKGWQPFAAHNASAFAFEMLANYHVPKLSPIGEGQQSNKASVASPSDSTSEVEVAGRVVTLNASFDNITSEDVEAITTALRKAASDASVRITRREKGSVRLYIEGSKDGLDSLQHVYDTGKLTKLAGFSVSTIVSEQEQPDLAAISAAIKDASQDLLGWETRVGEQHWIKRPELEQLLERIFQNDFSTTLLLGEPGSGKSALLAMLGLELRKRDVLTVAIKGDLLESDIDSSQKLSNWMKLPLPVEQCVRLFAEQGRVVLLLDQLDALASLVDLRSGRLNVLLNLVKAVSGLPNVHVVCSCRVFEYRHDVRLTSIKAEKLTLALPVWEQVADVLKDDGLDAAKWPERLCETLRVPQHLQVFLQRLRGTSEDNFFSSYQEMLDDLWHQKVTNPDGLPGREELLLEIAGVMASHEAIWLPVAQFEDRKELISDLQSQGILVRPDDRRRIGFQHQTLFEHARARAFANAHASLAKHVIERQDGLFVRPTLWSSLNYLREAAPAIYAHEMEQLVSVSLRLHIEYLLIEFLGQVHDPSVQEAVWINAWLDRAGFRNKVLAAIRGNRDWFDRLKAAQLPALMGLPAEEAWPVVGVLQEAWAFDPESCLDLIRRHWLPDKSRDGLTLNVLRAVDDWSDDAVELARTMILRTDEASYFPMMLAANVSENSPAKAARLAATYLNVRLDNLESQSDSPPEPLPENATNVDVVIRARSYSETDPFRKLLESSSSLNWLPNAAEKTPAEFLDNIWPWFLRALTHVLSSPNEIVIVYRSDSCHASDLNLDNLSHFPIVRSVEAAIRELAKTDTPAFLSFVKQWEGFDALVIQRLLCRGLIESVDVAPKAALSFLLADPRRLILGHIEDEHADSREMIRALVPRLSDSQVLELEGALLKSNYYERNVPDEDAQTRRLRQTWNREHRLRLLKTVPFDRLSHSTQALLESEEQALPEYREKGRKRPRLQRTGSTMSAEQMVKASNDNIVNLFDVLMDETEAHHPYDFYRDGSVQASSELERFASMEPQRAIELLSRFRPGKQERPVARILRALSTGNHPAESSFRVFLELEQRGFSGSEFHDAVAHACSQYANEGEGLPSNVCDLLESWLERTDGSNDDSDGDDDDDRRTDEHAESVLWQGGGGYTVPSGSYQLLHALTYGYLRQEPPAYDKWLSMLEKHLTRPVNTRTWRVICEELRFLSNCNHERATAFLVDLFDHYPGVRDGRFGVLLVARCRGFLPADTYRAILHAMRDSSWKRGSQAYGELLGLSYVEKTDGGWIDEEIESLLGKVSGNVTDRDAVWIGLAFAGANLWTETNARAKATDILARLAPFATGHLAEAIMSVFRRSSESFYADTHTKRLLETLADHPEVLREATDSFLVQKLEDFVTSDRDIVHRVSAKLVHMHGQDIGNPQTSFSRSAPHLTNIALTLQRTGGEFREKGLALFERLLELGVNDASELLKDLDGRPVPVYRSPRSHSG